MRARDGADGPVSEQSGAEAVLHSYSPIAAKKRVGRVALLSGGRLVPSAHLFDESWQPAVHRHPIDTSVLKDSPCGWQAVGERWDQGVQALVSGKSTASGG